MTVKMKLKIGEDFTNVPCPLCYPVTPPAHMVGRPGIEPGSLDLRLSPSEDYHGDARLHPFVPSSGVEPVFPRFKKACYRYTNTMSISDFPIQIGGMHGT